MSEPHTQQSEGDRAKRQIHIRGGHIAAAAVVVVAVLIIVGWANSGDDPGEPAAAPTTTTTEESTSALPTDQDMVDACHDVLEARMASNKATRGEVAWNTADVASSTKYGGYYDVTGTGTLDSGIQTPFSFTCLVEFGPPTVAVDNGFKLRP